MAEAESSSSSNDPYVGKTIDEKYEVVAKLGKGGMGVVYEAKHMYMERKVALKVLHRHFVDDDKYDVFLQRFRREAKTASKINHPHAVTIYDFGMVDDTPYLAMQFVEGVSLKKLISQNGPLALEDAAGLFAQICQAIYAAHKHNIIHRDIKPDNIMVSTANDGSNFAHVLDFGVAKMLSDPTIASATLTRADSTVGTPRYMSPEQIIGNDLDPRSDIYSLGMVLYEMLSADIPFEVDSSMQLVFHHVNTAPTPIRKLNPALNIPASVEKVVMKALAKDPNKRHQSVEELADSLNYAVSGGTASQRAASGEYIRGENSYSSPVARLGLIVGTSAALVAAIGFAIVNSDFRNSADEPLNITKTPMKSVAESTESKSVKEPKKEIAIASQKETKQPTVVGEPTAKQATIEQNVEPAEAKPPMNNLFASLEEDLSKQLEDGNRQQKVEPIEVTTMPTATATASSSEDSPVEEPIVKPTEQKPVEREELPKKSSPIVSAANLPISELIVRLGDEERAIREGAAVELQNRGGAPIPQLISALSNKSSRVRYWAAFILGKLNAKSAVEPLVATLDDRSPMVATTAGKALRRIDPQRAENILGPAKKPVKDAESSSWVLWGSGK